MLSVLKKKINYEFFTSDSVDWNTVKRRTMEEYEKCANEGALIPSLGAVVDRLEDVYYENVMQYVATQYNHIEHIVGYSELEKDVVPIKPDLKELSPILAEAMIGNTQKIKVLFIEDIKRVMEQELQMVFVDSVNLHLAGHDKVDRRRLLVNGISLVEVW